jgi:putative DNA primase/helicase
MLSQPKIKVRILGKSKNVDVPSMATIFATGNNLSIQGDLTRRSIMCRLDAEMEKPEERRFKREIFEYTMKKRGELIKAGLTILRAFHTAGLPNQNMFPMASFEDWSK